VNLRILNYSIVALCPMSEIGSVVTHSELAHTLPIFPHPLFLLAILNQDALAMLLSILPSTAVLVPIWPTPRRLNDAAGYLPEERAVAVLLVLDILALVALTVGPSKDSISVHLVVLPYADVLAAIAPAVCP